MQNELSALRMELDELKSDRSARQDEVKIITSQASSLKLTEKKENVGRKFVTYM